MELIKRRIDPTKSNKSRKCMICHYLFFNYGFKFQDYVCNRCHDFTMLEVNIWDIAIITIKNVNYRCIIYNISKSETLNLLKNREYILKNIVLNFSLFKTVFFLLFCLVYIKWLKLWTCLSL